MVNIDDRALSPRGTAAFLVALQRLGQPSFEVEEHLDELAELTTSAGYKVVGRAVQTRKAPHPATFIGGGKAEEIARALDELDGDLVVFDDDLSPGQVDNLEKIAGVPVIDRSLLILQIFDQRAKTSEARTQVELARLEYILPRLTRFWRHLGRQAGGIGLRGGEGEKQLEMDRRMLRQRISQLKKKLEKVEKTREVQRSGRSGVRQVALAGYTNAGKSTLFNRLTQSDETVRDRLFATLDPKLRRGHVGGRDVVVFSDTVGFIRKLPHDLVASFRSTLEEVTLADLVLHVVDRSHPRWTDQERVAAQVLGELGVEEDRILVVYNKLDLVEGPLHRDPSALYVSALTGEGIGDLKERIHRRLFPGRRSREPWLTTEEAR